MSQMWKVKNVGAKMLSPHGREMGQCGEVRLGCGVEARGVWEGGAECRGM